MEYYAYRFEAHTIQSYVMDGGKLADMVGASELLEALLAEDGPLDDTLEEAELKVANYPSSRLESAELEATDCRFSRRGGAAFYLLFTDLEKAKKLRDIWGLIVPAFIPGLQFTHAIGEGESQKTAIADGKNKLSINRNQPSPLLPGPGPLIRRAPRTGQPAVDQILDPDGQLLWVDAPTMAKQKYRAGTRLADKFLTDQPGKYIFPRNLEKPQNKEASRSNPSFPFKNGNTSIGIIHADGNGLGQILMDLADNLPDDKDNDKDKNYANVFFQLSQKIDLATGQAARQALKCVIENAEENRFGRMVLPARPLILGGDDLTIIVRGDLALRYANDYLKAFEETTKAALAELHEKFPAIPTQMTACAGIAFIKSSQPFYLGYQLAESLCTHAKKSSRAIMENGIIPSSLAFHKVKTTFIDDYPSLVAREMTIDPEDRNLCLTLGAYGTGNFAGKLPPFDELSELIVMFQQKEMARGPGRHLQTLLHADGAEAKRAWRRWQENMIKEPVVKGLFEQYESCTDALFGSNPRHPDLPFCKNSQKQWQSFLGDLYGALSAQGVDNE